LKGSFIGDDGYTYPEWVRNPNDSMEKKLRRWLVIAMCKQRGIFYRDIGEYLGVSQQRVFQMIEKADETALSRIEEAITEISKSRVEGETDPTRIVLTLGLRNEPEEVREAKIAASQELLEDARERYGFQTGQE
jgi:hypothetical protein